MKAKSILFGLFLFNLTVGNLLTGLLGARSETVAEAVLIHATFSLVAVLSILFLIWFLHKKSGHLVVVLASVLAAFLVPTLSIYILSAGYGLFQFEFASLAKGIPIAILSGIVSWFLWLPIGLINSIFLIAYFNKLRTTNTNYRM